MFVDTVKRQTSYFKADIKVYRERKGESGLLYSVLYYLTCHGLHAIALFRLGKIIYEIKVPILSQLLKVLYRLMLFVLSTLYGISINPVSEIGPGFYIGHYGGIFVRGSFGKNCSISQGVTFGSKGGGKSKGWPMVGDNVYVGAGAKVIGALKIGDNAVIGANAVVVKDVPEANLAVGVPARYKSLKQES